MYWAIFQRCFPVFLLPRQVACFAKVRLRPPDAGTQMSVIQRLLSFAVIKFCLCRRFQTCLHLPQNNSRLIKTVPRSYCGNILSGFSKVLTKINLYWECKEIIFSAEGAIKSVFQPIC